MADKQSDPGYTLLIWENIPDSTELYLIPNTIADERRDMLRQAHGKFINSDDSNEGLAFLNAALASEAEDVDEDQKSVAGLFAPFLHEGDSALEGQNITAVYISGFVM